MSKLIDEIMNDALKQEKAVSKAEFVKDKRELSEEEFSEQYYYAGGEYYKYLYSDMKKEEIDTYLLYASLNNQRKMKNSLSLIATILVIYTILSVIGAIVLFARF